MGIIERRETATIRAVTLAERVFRATLRTIRDGNASGTTTLPTNMVPSVIAIVVVFGMLGLRSDEIFGIIMVMACMKALCTVSGRGSSGIKIIDHRSASCKPGIPDFDVHRGLRVAADVRFLQPLPHAAVLVRRTMGALPLWLALALPVHATQDAWPALHDIAGIASDDVLNVRAAPDATSPIIGALPPGQTDVEVIRLDVETGWALVNLPEGTGWVSTRFLARHPGQWQGAFPEISTCFGTEPFWTLSVDGDTALFSTPEREAAGQIVARVGSAARRDRHGLLARIGDVALTGIVSARSCSDGMSDREWGLAFDAIHGDELLSGCCSLAR